MTSAKQRPPLPRELRWVSLAAWCVPELVLAGLLLFAMWTEWCLS